jgi:alpha-ketoglutarate-dependent taurine dioxygenase
MMILKYGGVLFRGLDLTNKEFAKLSSILFGGKNMFHNYDDGISPRTNVYKNCVFTSTEYSSSQEIFQHNELSYSHMPPSKIAFYCEKCSLSGGQTPIASSRDVLMELRSNSLTKALVTESITYRTVLPRSNLGLGRSWEETYASEDKEEVARKLQAFDVQFAWTGDTLATTRTLPCVRRHPVTGEEVWLNHAHLFHTASLSQPVESQLELMRAKPKSCTLANGADISREAVSEILSVLKRREHSVDWRNGDLMVLDNYLMSHGRKSFEGQRSLWVSLSK